MKAIYNYFMNADIEDFIIGVLVAAIIIGIIRDILKPEKP